MEYMPVNTPIEAEESLFEAPPGMSWTRFPTRSRTENTLRYRGLSLDLTTDAVLLHGHSVHLSAAERSVLKALMRHAGRIVSAAHLAAESKRAVAEIESLVEALCASLVEAGAECLPHRVEGLGYVLWR
ncbi:MAG TPA: hypothetical protein VF808_19045 [Ktedonobacterales bacterium]